VGMGKTIMMSALLHSSPPSELDEAESNKRSTQLKLDSVHGTLRRRDQKNIVPTATLIVAPTSLLQQWSEELDRSSSADSTSVLLWHGQNRSDLQDVIEGDDNGKIKIVITSYGVLTSEHAKSEKNKNSKSPIFESTCQ
jgi:DNA repair protein RAD5